LPIRCPNQAPVNGEATRTRRISPSRSAQRTTSVTVESSGPRAGLTRDRIARRGARLREEWVKGAGGVVSYRGMMPSVAAGFEAREESIYCKWSQPLDGPPMAASELPRGEVLSPMPDSGSRMWVSTSA
jgi:hypothetical protein